MRIISQSGRIDIPYEVAVVYVEYESIIAKVGDERVVDTLGNKPADMFGNLQTKVR